MSDEVESHTIRLLQEMRAEIRDLRADMTAGFGDVGKRFDEVEERFDDLTNRVDGNTLILNMLAGLVSQHEDRLDRPEEGRR